jgi:hypothetical protein
MQMIMTIMAVTHSKYYKDKYCITPKSNTENSHSEKRWEL